MSAAEKLRALNEQMQNARTRRIVTTAAGHDLFVSVSDALPQIVALVEFSESILGSLPRSHGPTMAQVLRELDEALT